MKHLRYISDSLYHLSNLVIEVIETNSNLSKDNLKCLDKLYDDLRGYEGELFEMAEHE